MNSRCSVRAPAHPFLPRSGFSRPGPLTSALSRRMACTSLISRLAMCSRSCRRPARSRQLCGRSRCPVRAGCPRSSRRSAAKSRRGRSLVVETACRTPKQTELCLLKASCLPASPPHRGGSPRRARPYAVGLWLLRSRGSRRWTCLTTAASPLRWFVSLGPVARGRPALQRRCIAALL